MKQEQPSAKGKEHQQKEHPQKERPHHNAPEQPTSTSIIRIASTDISGDTTVYHGLTNIKGISWALSNAICHSLNLDRKKKISELSAQEIESILQLLSTAAIPHFLVNRRNDIDSGQNKHLITNDLDLQRDFDIRRMKKMRSYKGWRHATGQPVRGQRTKSHFRKGSSLGVQRAKSKPAAAPGAKEKKGK